MLAIALCAALSIITPQAAIAHDALLSSSPAAQESVDTLPAQLTLHFSGQLIDDSGATIVEVTGPDGADAHAGAPLVDGAEVTVPLRAQAPAGQYRVVWRVVSSDGHPISGEFFFEVRTSTLPVPSAGQGATPTPEPSAPERPAPAQGLPLGVIAAIVGAGAVAVLGVAWFLGRRRSGAADEG